MSTAFAVGQSWLYPALEDFEESRIIVGHIEPVENEQDIICVAITHAPIPRQNGSFMKATIPFMPFSQAAMEQTVTELENASVPLPEEFAAGYEKWKADPDGLGFLQIPFMVLLGQISSDFNSDS